MHGLHNMASFVFVFETGRSLFSEYGDFSLGATSVTIPAGLIPTSGTDCVSLSAIDDTILEGNEDILVSITRTGQDAVTIGVSATTTVTITDNDGRSINILVSTRWLLITFLAAGQVQVVSPSVCVDEGSLGSICVILTATTGSPNELANPLTINLTFAVNAEAGLLHATKNVLLNVEIGDDYSCILFFTDSTDFSLGATSVTIPAGVIPTSGTDCVSVIAVDDTILEENEGFGIHITGTNEDFVTVGVSNTTTVIITDNDGT